MSSKPEPPKNSKADTKPARPRLVTRYRVGGTIFVDREEAQAFARRMPRLFVETIKIPTLDPQE